MVETILILSAISVGLSLITLVLVLTKLRRPDTAGRQDGEELARTKDELKEYVGMTARMQTDNVRNLFVGFGEALSAQTQAQRNGIDITDKRIEALTRTVSETLNSFRVEMQRTLGEIRQENTLQLEKMRTTVDEKLNDTLTKRFNESFMAITDNLNRMSQELGKMQSLATGVNDLKHVLTNVKTRGTWGEVALGNILEQMFTVDQYRKSFKVKPNSDEMVDYAVVLPGKESEVYLPIDSKFPIEDYHRLVDASERGDLLEVDAAQKALVRRIKQEAKSISDKYVSPPSTTDFAIMFLPTEGLYSEVLRTPGLAESLQNDHRIVVSGPTTITALLNSLQMGFKSVAIEKRSAEVLKLLAVFKKEFATFNNIIEKTQKRMESLANDIGDITKRSNIIQRKLRTVEALRGEEEPIEIELSGESIDV